MSGKWFNFLILSIVYFSLGFALVFGARWVAKNFSELIASIMLAFLTPVLIVFLVIASHEIFYGDRDKPSCQETSPLFPSHNLFAKT